MSEIRLGVQAEDIVTGMKGIVTGRAVWLNGCIQYCLKPKIGIKTYYPEGEWIDEVQIKVIGDGVHKKKKTPAKKKKKKATQRSGFVGGGPQRDAPRG